MKDLAITSLDTMTAFTIGADKKLFFILDELQNATLSNTEDTVDITGKQGRKISTIKRNKAATISGTNGLISGGLLAAQIGAEIASGTETVMIAESVTFDATTHKASVSNAPATNTSAYARIADANGALGDTISVTIGSTASSGKYDVTPDSAHSTFSGNAVVVYFTSKGNVDTILNRSDAFSEKYELFVDGTAEDACGQVYKIQIHFPKASFDGNFDLEMGENQAVHSFTAQALAGLCDSGELWEMFIFSGSTSEVA